MKVISLLMILTLAVTIGCSTNTDRKRHQLFLKQVQNKRENLTALEYKQYIKKMIEVKESELQALNQLQDKSNKMMDHHEVMASSTGRDTYSFNKTTTGMDLKKTDTRIKNVEKELYLLKSQLIRE
jgi:hypothetical protein